MKEENKIKQAKEEISLSFHTYLNWIITYLKRKGFKKSVAMDILNDLNFRLLARHKSYILNEVFKEIKVKIRSGRLYYG